MLSASGGEGATGPAPRFQREGKVIPLNFQTFSNSATETSFPRRFSDLPALGGPACSGSQPRVPGADARGRAGERQPSLASAAHPVCVPRVGVALGRRSVSLTWSWFWVLADQQRGRQPERLLLLRPLHAEHQPEGAAHRRAARGQHADARPEAVQAPLQPLHRKWGSAGRAGGSAEPGGGQRGGADLRGSRGTRADAQTWGMGGRAGVPRAAESSGPCARRGGGRVYTETAVVLWLPRSQPDTGRAGCQS